MTGNDYFILSASQKEKFGLSVKLSDHLVKHETIEARTRKLKLVLNLMINYCNYCNELMENTTIYNEFLSKITTKSVMMSMKIKWKSRFLQVKFFIKFALISYLFILYI